MPKVRARSLESSPGLAGLVGREPELRMLRAALARASSGEGGLVLLGGPAGIGKTSLLQTIEVEAIRDGFRTAWGHCLPNADEPFFPLEQVFLKVRGSLHATATPPPALGGEDPSSAPGRGGRGRRGRTSPGATPRSSSLPFAALAGLRSDRDAVTSRSPGKVMLDYLAILEQACREGRWLFLVDDLHWSDPESLQGLQILARSVRRLPVLLVAALREEELVRAGQRETIQAIRREGLSSELELKGLREGQARRLVELTVGAALDERGSSGTVGELVEWTGGNPYFLVETTRQLLADGKIRREGGRTRLLFRGSGEGAHAGKSSPVSFAVPTSVSDLILGRLRTLPAPLLELVEGAAVVGQRFSLEALSAMGLGPLRILEEEARGVCQERRLWTAPAIPGDAYRFAHPLLWETVSRTVPPERRGPWSRRLAAWLQQRTPADPERIARLHRDAGAYPEALLWIERGCSTSIRERSFSQSIRLLTQGLEVHELQGASAPTKGEWAYPFLELLWDRGAPDALQESLLRSLIDPSLPLALRGRWLLRLSEALVRGGDPEERAARVREAEELVEKAGTAVPPELQGYLLVVQAHLAYEGGQGSRKEKALAERALEVLPEGEVHLRAKALDLLVWCLWNENDWVAARERLAVERLLVVRNDLEGMWDLADANEAAVLFAEGNVLAAEESASRAARRAIRLGNPYRAVLFLSNLSSYQLERGQVLQAEESALQALRLAETFGMGSLAAVARQDLGACALRRGDPEEAGRLLKEAAREYDRLAVSFMRIPLAFEQAALSLLEGHPLSVLTELDRIPTEGMEFDHVPRWHLLRGYALRALGEVAESQAAWERALQASTDRHLKLWIGRAQWALARSADPATGPVGASSASAAALSTLQSCGVLPGKEGYPFLEGAPGASRGRELPPGRATRRPARTRRPLSRDILQQLRSHGGLPGALHEGRSAPAALTQRGIAVALGIERDRFNRSLSRLVERGLVVAELRHVEGCPRRVKVYALTPLGARIAIEAPPGELPRG